MSELVPVVLRPVVDPVLESVPVTLSTISSPGGEERLVAAGGEAVERAERVARRGQVDVGQLHRLVAGDGERDVVLGCGRRHGRGCRSRRRGAAAGAERDRRRAASSATREADRHAGEARAAEVLPDVEREVLHGLEVQVELHGVTAAAGEKFWTGSRPPSPRSAPGGPTGVAPPVGPSPAGAA